MSFNIKPYETIYFKLEVAHCNPDTAIITRAGIERDHCKCPKHKHSNKRVYLVKLVDEKIAFLYGETFRRGVNWY